MLSSDAKALEGFSREGRELSVAAAKFILKAHLPADGLKVEVDSRTANEIRSYGGGTHYDVNLRETQVELQIAP